MTEDEVQEVWDRVTQAVMQDPAVGPAVGAQLALALPRGIAAGTLYLAVQLEFTLKLLESRLRPAIMNAIAAIPEAQEIQNFVVIVDEDAHPSLDPEPTPEAAPAQGQGQAHTGNSFDDGHFIARAEPTRPVDEPRARHGGDDPGDSRLNEKYRFDSFVIGQSNRFAHAAAVAVAEAPARAYNPLFIYGDSGLGKTHLLHAIGHYARELFPDVRVRYVSSEDFTNDFINSIANNQGAGFHARYRSVDILLVDDIQFLADKVETQEAFFHTFNTLHDHNKQVVITSDVQPKQLRGFEERMLSRFEWGLLTDIQAPDLETRIAILRKKAQRENLEIDHNILEFIASKFSSNIRELEGTLIRVTAYASLNQQRIDMNLVHTVLKDLITLDADNEVQPSDIISKTAEYFDLSVDDLYGPTRAQQIATARQIAMYLCRELTPLSLPKIGQLFGGRDHTTVMYAHKKISQLIAERRSIYNQVTELTTRIKQGSR
ncbi:chromosomal replication initiator protein [Leucobacter luti]|uniref:Chromosomal replication initiator protein DnaA n=1 Tax=Leucobacter luti TaxID=340320 RepID=A0A4Q7U2I1_9MICO|nr:chromosomal replication initiator protein DnaA [Leucobacter luti]RZT66977.1 chromosomal replication initiator protein [Leucobacter luti]